MHVSDWFPTIAGLAQAQATAASPTLAVDLKLDGFDQAGWLLAASEKSPRSFLLYNWYTAGLQPQLPYATLAIRNERFKLVNAYINTPSARWYFANDEAGTDNPMGFGLVAAQRPHRGGSSLLQCSQASANSGDFTSLLFDLLEDPAEINNLYWQDKAEYTAAKVN